MLEIRELQVKLGKSRVLHCMDINIRPGEMTVVVGPNGSGKTTFLRAISGEIKYSGSIMLNNRELRQFHAVELALTRAVLPQSNVLSFPFTVHEVVALGISASAEKQTDQLVKEALEKIDLKNFASRFYQELSGGEQQRVQLARVLCQVWQPVLDGTPRWLFLDEPVSSLDISHQLTLMNIARDFARRGGGVVAIMHDLNLSTMFANNIAVMSEGRLAAFGKPDEVICDRIMNNVFGVQLSVSKVPDNCSTYILPQAIQE